MSNRVEGERVVCYQCENEWDRAHGGLQCPRCESEFVEILSPGGRSNFDDPPEVAPESPPSHDSPFQSIRNHNPWNAPDPDEGDIRTIHFNTGGGGNGTFSFSRTYTFGGPQRGHAGQDPAADQVMQDFESMVNNMLGGRARNSTFGGSINVNGRTTTFGSGTRDAGLGPSMLDPFSMMFPGSPGRRGGAGGAGGGGGLFDVLGMLLDPRNARSGDAVYSQEALDQIMSQLMEQHQQNGAPPASQDLINQLPKQKVNSSMVGEDGKAECSICMDNVELETEVTTLPCTHWFHFECIESWLKEHDTCPHCRKPITPDEQRQNQRQRRPTRRSSSVATPFQGTRENPHMVPDSPSNVRAAREQYFGRQRYDYPEQRPSSERRSSRRSTGDDSGGGVWNSIRSRLPFSGS